MFSFNSCSSQRSAYRKMQETCMLTLVAILFLTTSGFPKKLQSKIIDDAMPSVIADEIVADWKDQDGTMESIKQRLIDDGFEDFAARIEGSGDQGYLSARHWNRVARMSRFEAELEKIMFTRHHNFGGILVGYHDNVDAGNADSDWSSNSALCVLNFKNYYSEFDEIITKRDGVIRDPCISFDGTKALFAMSPGGKGTGYNIYEMEIDDPSDITQLTKQMRDDVVADFEPCYLPNGDIMFTSSRNFGLVDCAWNPTTNMFLMHGDGTNIHQIGFDQVQTFYPVIKEDGAVLYTRWEYNDRDLTNNMGLFMMNPDGAHQTEFFGNQTGWPFTFLHARPIPGEPTKAICVAGGHHGPYSGELMIVDNSGGFNGPENIQMIAPLRPTEPATKKSDIAMGDVNFHFQNPYPLSSNYFLVSWRPTERDDYRLYFMDVEGNRELIAWADQSLSQPVSMMPREVPFQIAPQANYNKTEGAFTMQDVYIGGGMEGVERGTAKSLRVVKISYRAQGSGRSGGSTMGSAPSGAFAPAIFVPVSQYGASWEAKEVLGEVKIEEDGSAAFKVPARTPVYFQVIDEDGYAIASMRSWSTLMPGETFSCVGCHENKNEAPPATTPIAQEPVDLETPLGIENRPFDYGELVQPILDEHCVSCHGANHASGFDLRGDLVSNSGTKKSWTRSYNSLLQGIGTRSSNKAVNLCYIFIDAEQQPPYSFGSSQSGMMKAVNGAIPAMSNVSNGLTQTEKNILSCWIDLVAPHAGTYSSYMSSSDASAYKRLEEKRERWIEIEKESLEALAAQWVDITGVNDPGNKNSTSSMRMEKLSLEYMPTRRAFVLKEAFQGKFMLVDLRGRVISRITLSDRHTNGDVTIALPTYLGAGLYLARFEGVDGKIQQAKISISQ